MFHYVPAHEFQYCFSSREVHVERRPPLQRRRRGPRSVAALKRPQLFRFTTLVGAPGKSGAEPASVPNSQLLVSNSLSVNVVGFGGSNSFALDSLSATPKLESFCEQLRILNVNVRKLVLRKAELEARLVNANVDILLLQETWLSESVEEVQIA